MKRELAGIALILLAVFLGGALIEHQLLDPSRLTGNGFFGPVGTFVSGVLVRWLGTLASALVPFVPLVHGLRLLGRMQAETDRRWMLFLLGLTHLVPIGVGLTLGDVAKRVDDSAAGLWGGTVSFVLATGFGEVGAWITVVLLLSGLTAWTLRWNPVRALVGPSPAGSVKSSKPTLAALLEPSPDEMPEIERAPNASSRESPSRLSAIDSVSSKKKRAVKGKEGSPSLPEEVDEVPGFYVAAGEDALEFQLPAADILSAPPPGNVDVGKREIEVMGEKLMSALRTFRVDGALVGKTTGPVVTQYEVEPAPGVKVRQFANLANDLALAMRAASIRVVAPIPGRGAVGVEVPNPIPQIVAFRELIESREFSAARMALPIALGKDLEGKAVVADLAKMPHLLIAGATGSGKSVCVNTIITSLIYRHTPETLKFLMVDPKMVELSAYNDLPHMLNPVITDNRDAPYVLKWA
ncbi:MAG: DNA translocase FtsK 4TM domain-containing protein, partial [Gemmatimonadaceae bacterium]